MFYSIAFSDIGACEAILKHTKSKGNFEEQLRVEHSLLEGVDSKENLNYLEELICRQVRLLHSISYHDSTHILLGLCKPTFLLFSFRGPPALPAEYS